MAMFRKTIERVNHNTGDKLTKTVSKKRNGDIVIEREVKVSDGWFGTRLFGTRKKLSDVRVRKGR